MKITKKVLSVLLAVFLMAGCAAMALAAGGNLNDSITWNYDESTQILTVSGTGDMPNYGGQNSPPWYANNYRVETIVIEDGVTSIGFAAFYSCKTLKTVTIPASVKKIEGYAFYGTALETVNYAGSKKDWNNIQVDDSAFSKIDSATGAASAIEFTIHYNYGAIVCPWCGGEHTGFFGGFVGWIHGILATIFGAKY
ncbi:MAG: leucine-rich repeat protein [Clostridia bacterium]|nr:leucine-rich repeat protein [Clostridia bacterium]